jgi:hypothetical protein
MPGVQISGIALTRIFRPGILVTCIVRAMPGVLSRVEAAGILRASVLQAGIDGTGILRPGVHAFETGVERTGVHRSGIDH